jgi:transcriptional regulator NrdR family protein
MCIQIDLDQTTGMKSLITDGSKEGRVYLDSAETSFHIACLMKDFECKADSPIYGDESFDGYEMTNRFANANRDLTLYKPLTMMRNVITFSGENDNYTVDMSLVPFLKYSIALDTDKMAYFTRAFSEQYTAMEPVLSKLDGNSYLDMKLYNTYGRANNYFIGPQDGVDNLWDSEILLDNVYVQINLRLSVYDRSMYTQTVEAVVNEIKTYFNALDAADNTDIHVSDLIHTIVENQPNVRYVRFIGFNDYDANKQSIFVKYDDISELKEDQLRPYVPELLRVDSDSISIVEET